MITINLLKDKGQATQLNTEVINIKNLEKNDSENGMKVFAIVGFVILLYAYEWYNISSLKDEAMEISAQTSQVQVQIDSKKAQAKKVEQDQKKVKDLKNKMKVIGDISKTRLTAIKTLDYLQVIIPEKIWLDSIKYKGNEMTLLGFSFADEPLTDFVEKLERKQDFASVLLKKSEDIKLGKSKVKKFEINTVLNNTDK